MMNIRHLFGLLLLVCYVFGRQAIELPATIDKSKYGSNVKTLFSGKLTMYFLADTTNNELEVALEGNCEGAVGWGMSRSGKMLNSDVYIGWVTNGVPTAYDYSIGTTRTFSASGVWPDTMLGGTDDLLAFNGSEVNGVTQMIFRRKFSTGDSLDVDIPMGQSITLIYYYQDNVDGPNLVQHSQTPTPYTFNFFTGASTTQFQIIVVHGALMFIAWYCIAPFGFVLARFMKGFSWWFQVHRAIMFIAMLAVIAAFGIAISYCTTHFDDAHKIIGLIVVIIGVAQPVIGFLADKMFDPNRKATPIFPDKTHWVLGWLSITLGMINIILGLNEYQNTKKGVLVAYCVVAGITFVAIIAFTIFRLIKPANSGH